MKTFNRKTVVFALTALVAFALTSPLSSEEVASGGESNTSQTSDNQKAKRRNRNRNNDNQIGGFQFGGSNAQQIQQAIEGFQGNSNDNQHGANPASSGGQLPSGKKFKKGQQLQTWHQNAQGNLKKKHKHNDWQGWAIQFGGPAPFSAQWYTHHPNAWHHHDLDDDDAWKVITAAGVLAWLGWHNHHPHHTVIYEPVPVETIYVQSQPPVVLDASQWMTLGVYSLMTGPDEAGTRILELAVDKFGRVRGNYYDAIINASHTVTGRIDQPTQYVQWSLDSNKQLVFYAPLSQLTQPQGVVNVRFPGGQQEQWQISRMENGEN